METKKHFRTISGILIMLLLMISSCSTSKRAAITCSEFYYYKNNKTSIVNTRIKKRYPSQGRIIGKRQHTGSSRKIQGKKRVVLNNSSSNTVLKNNFDLSSSKYLRSFSKSDVAVQLHNRTLES